MSSDALKDLHTSIVDAREGYATAVKDAEDSSLRSLFQQTDDSHAAAHADIHKALDAKGEKADDSGSFMGTVHKTVISVRSAVTGLDRGSLGAFADGEENIVKKYDDAIGEETDPSVRSTLEGHRGKLSAKIAEMRRLAEQQKAGDA